MQAIKPMTDGIFKYIFGYKENIEYTEYLLECLFNERDDAFKERVKVLYAKTLDKSNYHNRGYETDVMVFIDETIMINLEAYIGFPEVSKKKSFAYMSNLFYSQFKEGDSLKTPKIFIQYNFVKDEEVKSDEYRMMSINDEHVWLFDSDIFVYRVINVGEENKNISNKLKRLLKFLNSDNMEEARIRAKGDEKLMSLYEKMSAYINGGGLDKLNEIYQRERHEYDIEVAREKALSEGISQGISQGIQKTTTSIVKNMLNENADLNYISKITGLSKKEIEKLK